ncbi:acetoacetyl-CoA synthetase [Rhizoctonia solani AG-1 IB]|uniref:Acetoacetyl-CoA synthetase n=1 Tax=Thanatephorus cucumeris (strain AG1-IB / isolate 7/3/14) TaxID=1108050 RepID=A0A0B7FNL6_THACB|nr:acetoacetyl-CoA synthetase [Rhizoctonia solani AG-1 IB]
MADLDSAKLLWTPANAHETRTTQFMRKVNAKYGLSLSSYDQLWSWSTENIAEFWDLVWEDTNIIGDRGPHVIDRSALPADNPDWFVGSQVNWAENALWCRASDKIAIIEAVEPTPDLASSPLRQITYAELYIQVADIVSALIEYGVKKGDRVASYSSNCIETAVVCLATAAIGALWVSAAADFGPDGVLERFEQVKPKVIFAVNSVSYNGKRHPHIPKLRSLLAGLHERKLEAPKVVIIDTTHGISSNSDLDQSWEIWSSFIARGASSKAGRNEKGEIAWTRVDFNHPLWVMFSSGTTGKPKPIVHRTGGMLIQSRKELLICADMKPSDVFFYYTTTGWMMYQFLMGGLGVGCTILLYDGSPLRDPSCLWRMTDECKITIFGTSAKYLDQLAKGYKPQEHHDLSSIRHIYSTGSPLAPQQFDYVYKHISKNALLGSITGGTDICSLFAGMNSSLPVYRGEVQCRMLGMAIEAYSAEGSVLPIGETGELVCLKPFPCQPAGFWPLSGYGTDEEVSNAQSRYQDAYFNAFKGIWHHGDYVRITTNGGVVMLGRSDGVLNPGGIRFGSSEIYEVLDQTFSAGAQPLIVDSLVVGQAIQGGADERVILFVKLPEGETLSDDFRKRIREEIRKKRSPRHCPEKILQVHGEIPHTLNGKRVEVPVKKIINGALKSTINPATLRNPECLDEFVQYGQELRAEVF